MNSTSIVGHESIARRAHQIWEASGRPGGNETAHWLQAERELHEATVSTAHGEGARRPSVEPAAAAKHVPEKARHSADYIHPGVTTDSLHHHRNRTGLPR